jgi:hypothetical protein
MDQRAYLIDDATERNVIGVSGVCWRLEAFEHLADPTDKALTAWLNRAHQQALNLLKDDWPILAAQRDQCREVGLDVRTLSTHGDTKTFRA